jgi:hypothetical protein
MEEKEANDILTDKTGKNKYLQMLMTVISFLVCLFLFFRVLGYV